VVDKVRRATAQILNPVDSYDQRISVTAVPDLEVIGGLARAKPVRGWRHDRSGAFYRWRLGNPDRTYRFVTWTDAYVRGFLLLALMPHDAKHLKIVDHGAEDPQILRALLEAVTMSDGYDVEAVDPVLGVVDSAVLDRIGLRRDAAAERLTRRSFMMRSTSVRSQPPAQRHWEYDLIDSMLA